MAVRSRAFNFECPLVDSNGLSLTEEHQDLDLGQLRCFYGTAHECDYILSDGSPNGTEIQDCPAIANAARTISVTPQTSTVTRIQTVVTTAISSGFSTLVYSTPTSTFTTHAPCASESLAADYRGLSPALVGLSVIVALQSLAILGFAFVLCGRRRRRRAQNRASEEGKFVVHRVTGDHDLSELADLAPPIPLTQSVLGTGTSSPLVLAPPRLLLDLSGADPFAGNSFDTIPPEPEAESEHEQVENHLPSDDTSLAETTSRLAPDFERENALLRERIEMMEAEIQEQRDLLAQMDVFPPQYRSRSVSSVSTSTD
ncbi:hypothetical protein C8F01DRAFT_636991 [Mycena amicta]|nr:hypothetical protein C8F01DRAFT_636991 [Mycena amicta]